MVAVDADVLVEVVAARKALAADGACKGLEACVGAVVASQLIAAREAPLAVGPAAAEGLVALVAAQVCLEV